jgi:hypothetical protein
MTRFHYSRLNVAGDWLSPTVIGVVLHIPGFADIKVYIPADPALYEVTSTVYVPVASRV